MTSAVTFPLDRMDSMKLHLMNSSYYHKQKTLEETDEMLSKDGDYFIQVWIHVES